MEVNAARLCLLPMPSAGCNGSKLTQVSEALGNHDILCSKNMSIIPVTWVAVKFALDIVDVFQLKHYPTASCLDETQWFDVIRPVTGNTRF
jgi:hypothetical protein